MKYQRRHYEDMAAMVRGLRERHEMDESALTTLREELVRRFSIDNPRFHVGRFREACEPVSMRRSA